MTSLMEKIKIPLVKKSLLVKIKKVYKFKKST